MREGLQTQWPEEERRALGLNHHILGDQAECQMLFVQLVK